MEAIMTSMRSAVVVTDRDMHINLWNSKAENLWGVRSDEVEGKVFTTLDIGLPVSKLATALRKCAEGQSEFEQRVLDAINRRGKQFKCRVSCTRLVTPDNLPRGLIILMEEWNDGAFA
jgi:two-component system CheB/CheR fusion protein